MKILYSLGKNVRLRKERKGGIIFVKSRENALFFYVPENFSIFLKMKNQNACIEIDTDNFKNIKENLNFLSYMIKNGLFVHKNNSQKKLRLTVFPTLISLFITPTVHFRKYYSYGKKTF
jgi:hypothetical protein